MPLIYQNNFPREKAVKDQEFKGDKDLKAELLSRGIIKEGELKKEVKVAVENTRELEAKVEGLETEKSELEAKVEGLEKLDASILAGKINELDETANAKTMKEAIVALKASLKGE